LQFSNAQTQQQHLQKATQQSLGAAELRIAGVVLGWAAGKLRCW
jgi:hypothetical protein